MAAGKDGRMSFIGCAAVAAACSLCAGAADRIVAARDYEQSAVQKGVSIMGRDFYVFHNECMQDFSRLHPELPMFDHPFFCLGGPGFEVKPFAGFEKRRPEKELYAKRPLRFEDMIAQKGWEQPLKRFAEFEKNHPGHPYFMNIGGLRMAHSLPDGIESESEGLRQWLRQHPGCMGIEVFSEDDASYTTWLVNQREKAKDSDYIRQMFEGYPREYGKTREWLVKDAARARNYCFNYDSFVSLWSVLPSQAHELARLPETKVLWYECEQCATTSPWRWAAAYARGAARQFRKPFAWYTAMCNLQAVKRNGKSPEEEDGVNMWIEAFTYWPNPNWPKTVKYLGSPRSLMRRNYTYGYFLGSRLANVECAHRSLFSAEGPDGKAWGLSPYGKDFNRFCDWNRKRPGRRGDVYAPISLVTSLDENLHRQTYNQLPAKDEGSIPSFLFTLTPLRTQTKSPAEFSVFKRGEPGCMWNSEFGEVCDFIVADAGEGTERLTETLNAYKAAFLVGYHDPKLCDRKALAAYVKNGGTLFCSCDQVADGLVDAQMAGVSFDAAVRPCGKQLLDERKNAVETFAEPYTIHCGNPTAAKPLLMDENGGVIAWTAASGKGRVVTVAVRRMMPDAYRQLREDGWKSKQWFNEGFQLAVLTGKRTLPIVHYLLKRVQDETMPVEVAGDIQWGLNKVADGSWFLWLINNNGVTKFALEPEELDLAKTSKVTVNLKDLKGAVVTDITDPDTDIPIAVAADGTFTVLVRPGEDCRVAIKP